ncbi:MAG: poly-beta-1,6-N-acetyl-D-glucosamine biosynthesis protein PgaD [bacterium]|nr:poly-beta-1,6-N-acetyl-D-glucosamine biosynthesis protein PgaD [bacterium]
MNDEERTIKNDYSHLIIETPQLQTLKHRFSSSLITFFFWAAWFYLWLPVISLLAWLAGIRFFYDHMVGLGGAKGFVQILLIYLAAVLLIGLIFFAWAYYNNKRFKYKKRRGAIWKIGFTNLAERYKLNEDQVLNAKSSRRLVVHFDEAGNIIDLTKGKRGVEG